MEDELNAQIAELESNIQELDAELEDSLFRISVLEDDNFSLEREVSELEDSVQELESELEGMKSNQPEQLLREFRFEVGNLFNDTLVEVNYTDFKSEEDAFVKGVEFVLKYMNELA